MAQTKRIGSPHPERAQLLRRTLTEPEQRLWKALRARQLGGLKFRRQTAVGAYLEGQGFRVIRFSNADVMSKMDGVLLAILAAVRAPSPSQASGLGPSLSRGERGE